MRWKGLLLLLAVVSLAVWANYPPQAQSQVLYTRPNEPVEVVLIAEDIDGDPLEFEILGEPECGKLIGSGSILTYIPKLGFEGRDRFSYRVRDPQGLFDIGMVEIVVSSKISTLKIHPHPPSGFSLNGLLNLLQQNGVQTWYVVERAEPKAVPQGITPFVFAGQAEPKLFLLGPKDSPKITPIASSSGLTFLDLGAFSPGEYLLLVIAGRTAYSLPIVIRPKAPERMLAYGS